MHRKFNKPSSGKNRVEVRTIEVKSQMKSQRSSNASIVTKNVTRGMIVQNKRLKKMVRSLWKLMLQLLTHVMRVLKSFLQQRRRLS